MVSRWGRLDKAGVLLGRRKSGQRVHSRKLPAKSSAWQVGAAARCHARLVCAHPMYFCRHGRWMQVAPASAQCTEVGCATVQASARTLHTAATSRGGREGIRTGMQWAAMAPAADRGPAASGCGRDRQLARRHKTFHQTVFRRLRQRVERGRYGPVSSQE